MANVIHILDDFNLKVPQHTFESAIYNLLQKYLQCMITSAVISSIKMDIDIINYQFNKRIEVEIKDGTIILHTDEVIELPSLLTRNVIFEKRYAKK